MAEDDYDQDNEFERKYDALFGAADEEETEYELDAITGRRHKRPKMSLLNKSKISKQELDELFLQN